MTHDYTNRYWGHDYAITGVIEKGQHLDMMGWGMGLNEGDFLILPNGEETTQYQIESVRYLGDPRDMWSLRCRFVPRHENIRS